MTSVGSYWEKKMANITVKADSSLACDLRFFLLICSQQPPRDEPLMRQKTVVRRVMSTLLTKRP